MQERRRGEENTLCTPKTSCLKSPLHSPCPVFRVQRVGSWRSVLILMRGRLYNTAGVLRQDAWPLRAKAFAEDAVRPCSLQAVRLYSLQVKAPPGLLMTMRGHTIPDCRCALTVAPCTTNARTSCLTDRNLVSVLGSQSHAAVVDNGDHIGQRSMRQEAALKTPAAAGFALFRFDSPPQSGAHVGIACPRAAKATFWCVQSGRRSR